jgi:hypothetical protein
VAAQDQAISTNYFKNKILKEEIESKYWLCKQHKETIDHLTSGCPILVKNKYLMLHIKVCTHFHYSVCKSIGTETTDKWYTHIHTPKPVNEVGDVTVLWTQAVHTDREETAHTADIIIKNKKEKRSALLHVATPIERNFVQNEGEKKKKKQFMYRDTTNVEPEMYDYTSNNWGHWNSNEKLKETFGSCTKKIFYRFTTKDSYTWNITHNTESTSVKVEA